MADRMALFKAAKAQRGSSSAPVLKILITIIQLQSSGCSQHEDCRQLIQFTCHREYFNCGQAFVLLEYRSEFAQNVLQTKEQIKALKAQKAKAAAEAEIVAREAAEQQRKHEVFLFAKDTVHRCTAGLAAENSCFR